MNKEPEIHEYELPARLMSYLINGDASGIEPAEAAQLDKFAEKQVDEFSTSHHWDVRDGDSFFTYHHDMIAFGVLACDCVKVNLVEYPPSREELLVEFLEITTLAMEATQWALEGINQSDEFDDIGRGWRDMKKLVKKIKEVIADE